jgi:hypothetical protein
MKLRILALIALLTAPVAFAQVPVSGSTGTFTGTVQAPYSLMNFAPTAGAVAGTSAVTPAGVRTALGTWILSPQIMGLSHLSIGTFC